MNHLITKGPNPYAPIAEIRNRELTPDNPYEKLSDRVQPLLSDRKILEAVLSLKERIDGNVYQPHHFGRLELVKASFIDINVDIQRLLEKPHIVNIIFNFDPRILQPVNVTYIKATGRYSAWNGQHSSAVFAVLLHFGLIDPETLIQCKVVDDDLTVPGSSLVGEALGNFSFRIINGNGSLPVDAFSKHRSRVNGVRKYNSNLQEDLQSLEIQKIMEKNKMFPWPTAKVRGKKLEPGMITYIHGVNSIAGHNTDPKSFKTTKTDLDFALSWHNTYFPNELGVDGGIILTMGRLHAASRGRPVTKKDPGLEKVPITKKLEKELADLIRNNYLNPVGFHQNCKTRLNAWQKKKNLPLSWSDSCLTPILIIDYLAQGGTEPVPLVGITVYNGI